MDDSIANFDLAVPPKPATSTDSSSVEIETSLLGPLFSDAVSQDLFARFDSARRSRKLKIEPEMLADLRRRDGEYDPDILARLQAQGGGSTVFDNITDTKCSGVEAMLADIWFFSGDKPWGLEATPIPELDEWSEQQAIQRVVGLAMEAGVNAEDMDPRAFDSLTQELKAQIKDEIEAEAKKRAAGMEKLIEDQLAEGGFEQAMNDFLSDLATHKVAALMGPCPKIVKRTSVHRMDDMVGVVVEDREVLGVERISPLDIYPAALSVRPEDGDFFVRRRISRDAAVELRKLSGVVPDRLAAALARKASGDDDVDTVLAQISAKTNLGSDVEPDSAHELIMWWHRMTRREIAGFNREAEPEEAIADEMVPMTGLMLNGVVIKAVPNLDPTGKPNVFVASFRRRPGSFWGQGASGLAKGQQEQVNVIARALNTNVHFSSRVSYQADQAALVDPKALAKTFPGQVIYTQLPPGDNRRPVEPIVTPNYTTQLLQARNQAAAWLDEKSGVYPQSYGSPAQVGPAETLGGYQLLRQDQTKTIKRTLAHVSEAIGGLIRAYWLYNMMFSEDESIKGDVEVVTRGAVQLYMTSEDADQMLAVLELVSKNPLAQASMKPDAVAYLMREVLRMRRMDADKIIKSEAEIEADLQAAKQAEAAAQAEQQGAPQPEPVAQARPDRESELVRAQAEMIRAQAQAEKVGIEREKLAIERADRLVKIRKAQQELAQMRMAAAMPAMPEAAPRGLAQMPMGQEAPPTAGAMA